MIENVIYCLVQECEGFQWDDGNARKNEHRASQAECEQIFSNQPLLLLDDSKHSQDEPRFHALGITNEGRKLLIAFTIRDQLIRVISARDMSLKERLIYEQE